MSVFKQRRGLNLQCFVGGEALLTNSDAADAIRLDYQLLSALLSSRGGTWPERAAEIGSVTQLVSLLNLMNPKTGIWPSQPGCHGKNSFIGFIGNRRVKFDWRDFVFHLPRISIRRRLFFLFFFIERQLINETVCTKHLLSKTTFEAAIMLVNPCRFTLTLNLYLIKFPFFVLCNIVPSVDFLHKIYAINLLSGKVLIPYCHIITWYNSNVGRDQEVFVFKTLLNVIHFVCIQSRVSWKQRPQDLPPNDSELNWLGLGNWVNQVPFKSLYWANWPEIWLTQFPNPNLRAS